MKSIIESINNRELAFLLWLTVLMVYLFRDASTRRSAASILRMFFWSKLTSIFVVVTLYTACIATLLSRWDLWDKGQLKNTVLWYFTVGAVALFHITDKEKSNYFKVAVKDVLGITALLSFIIGVYSFSFIIELFIVPLTFLLVGTLVVAKRDKQHNDVARLLNHIIVLAGLFLVGYTAYRIISDFGSFANEGTLKDFLIPALFSFFFLPVLYVLSIVVTHEDMFTGIERKIKHPPVRRYAKWKALVHFHVNKTDLHRWRKIVFLQGVKTKEDVKKSIELVREMKQRERNRPSIDYEKGWSPYVAKEFLKKEGVATGFYQPVYEDEWMACSEYVKLDEEILANNIAYYVEGNAAAASKLKLTLSLHNKEHANIAVTKFFNAAKLLYESALKQAISLSIEKAIIGEKNWETMIGNRKVKTEKKKWEEHKAGGYNLTFTIEVV